MTPDPFSASKPSSLGASPAIDQARFLAAPYNARLVDRETTLLLVKGETLAREVSLQLVRILSQCDRYRSLDEHAAHAVRALQLPGHQIEAVRQGLDRLVEMGLLHSAQALLDRMCRSADDRDTTLPPPRILFIRTCARAQALERLLESATTRPLPGWLEHIIVLDDAPDAADQQAARRVIDRFRSRLPCRLDHINHDRRTRLLRWIAEDAGIDSEVLAWSVLGNSSDPAPSYGASLNLALLLAAGERFLIMDDDATFETFELPGEQQGPAFRRRQSARLHFPEPDWSLTEGHYPSSERHPAEAHAEFLGASANSLADRAGPDMDRLLADLDPPMLARLDGSARIRLTSSGTLGDPGTGGIHWLFAEDPRHLGPLCENRQRYHDLIGQRRLARCADAPAATDAFALMTTTLTGIDNTDPLLPTQPRGSNEDLLFGALVRYAHPASLQMGLPHMLCHARPKPRRWRPEDIGRPRPLNRGDFLAAQLEILHQSAPAGDFEQRTTLLAEALNNLACARHQTLSHQLGQELMAMRCDLIERIHATRSELRPPPWLDEDFERATAAQAEMTDTDRQILDEMAGQLPVFLQHYAECLRLWPIAWRHCQRTGTAHLLEHAG